MNIWRAGFWCALAGREAEVGFVSRALPGLWQPRGVRSRSAFAPPTAVGCRRRCLDAESRHRWPWALPVPARIEDTV